MILLPLQLYFHLPVDGLIKKKLGLLLLMVENNDLLYTSTLTSFSLNAYIYFAFTVLSKCSCSRASKY